MTQNNNLNSSSNKKWLPIILSLIGVILISYYLIINKNELYRIRQFSIIQILILFFVNILILIITAVLNKILLKLLNVNITLFDSFMINTISSVVNIIPLGATGFKAIYLKKVHGLNYINYTLFMLLNLLIVYIVGGLIGLFNIVQIDYIEQNTWFNVIILIFALYVIIPTALLIFIYYFKEETKSFTFWGKIKLPEKIINGLNSLKIGITYIRNNPKLFINAILCDLVIQLLIGYKLWLISFYLGYIFNLKDIYVMYSLIIVINALPLPNSIFGLRESISGLGTKILGDSSASGIIITGFDRIISTTISIVIGGAFILFNKKIRDFSRK